MIIFSDLHLRERSEFVCFEILDEIEMLAQSDPDGRVVCCGDFWHIRYQLSVRLLNRVAQMLQRWSEKEILLDIVPGNHDQVDVNGRNALEVFEGFAGVCVWSEPGVEDSGDFGYVPYRKDPQQQKAELDAVVEAVNDGAIICGHGGVHGAVMNNGRKNADDGLERDEVSSLPGGIRLVLGHYHKPQVGPYYQYVGSPYQTNYGEAGNEELGYLQLVGSELRRIESEVAAPQHYILKWDPGTGDPPPHPGREIDHVRLDIVATQEMIISGKFKTALKKHGLQDAQVNVVPVSVERDHRFAMQKGESLVDAARRFVAERMHTDEQGAVQQSEDESRELLAVLEGWL